MDNYNPLETVRQLRAWVKESLSSLNTVPLAEAKARYREITKVIDQLKKLHIPIYEDIKSEKEALEELISTSDEKEKLISLAKELSSLARDINHQLRGMRSPRAPGGGKAPPKKLRVTFPDGTVIFENKAVETFVKSLQCIGLKRVSELKSIRSYGGHPIVSRKKNESAGHVREIDGYFIETKSSTEQKARHIQDIARALHIEISVDVMD